MAEHSVERVEMGKGETADALDLVQEMQSQRATRLLKAVQVPKILLPYQARWHADKSVVRICEKSRRIGFSWGALAAEGALEAASINGMDQYYMGYNMSMAAENIGDVAFFARAYGLVASEISVQKERAVIDNERRDVITYKIRFASGWVYEALSNNPHNWRSRQGHARVDEAAFHQNIQEVIKGALSYRLWGGRIDLISTHNGDDNYFNQVVKEVKAGKLNWSHHYIDFDSALREGFYKRVCLVKDLPWSAAAEEQYRADAFADYPDQSDANEELLCIPKTSSGSYFTRLLYEQCQSDRIPVICFAKGVEWVTDENRLDEARQWFKDTLKPLMDSLPGLRSVLGQDFGRSGDLSVLWPLQKYSGKWKTPFLLELRNIPFDVQSLITNLVIDHLPLFHHAKFDARGNGQAHAEAAMQRYGQSRIDCVMLTQQWYAEHFPRYRSAFEDKSIVVPASEDMIADHRRVVLKKGMPGMDQGRDKGSDGLFRHGDSAVAGVMAWAAAREEGEPAAGVTLDADDDVYLPDAMTWRQRFMMFGRR